MHSVGGLLGEKEKAANFGEPEERKGGGETGSKYPSPAQGWGVEKAP